MTFKSGVFSNADVDTSEDVATIDVRDYDTLFLSFLVGVANLSAFVVVFKVAPGGDELIVANAGAHYTSPSGVVLGASGDLTTAAAGATPHWLKLNVASIDTVILRAAGTSSTVTGDYGANGPG